MTSPFSERECLLLRAALNPDPDAASAGFGAWASQVVLEEAPYPELRLLTAVYANLSRIAAHLRLPSKLKGKARATFVANILLARECLPTIEALGEKCPALVAKGLALCVRFDAWSARMMGDADVHVPSSSLETAADILRGLGWVPKYGMTWESLVHRTALRRSSWNFVKGEACLDLHWRPQPETTSAEMVRNMWATSESHVCLGRAVRLQSAEQALATSLAHGFKYGTHGDKLQTIVDASMLLRACRADILEPLISALGLRESWATVTSSLEEAGALAAGSPARELTDRMEPARRKTAAKAPSSAGLVAGSESTLLRRPALYRLWEKTGHKARLERLLIRVMGPFSKPLKWSGEFRDDYDLRDCAVIDRIGGPGWGWPEPDGTCFWSDRADVRLLIPLRGREDHMIVLGLSETAVASPNFTIHVFANGSRVTAMDVRHDRTTSQYCFFVSRYILSGAWVELSFRPRPYLGSDVILPETYYLSRGLSVSRLQIYRTDQANRILSHNQASRLHLRVLSGNEPEASKFKRIKARIETSPHRTSPALPEGFDPLVYIFTYPDLFEAEVDPYEHFLAFGRQEGRRWR